MKILTKSNSKILIVCESSGTVRDAFINNGIHAVSCDTLPSESNLGEHIQGDAMQPGLINYDMFDLIIAHPPCTYLCNSGVRWLYTGGKSNEAKDNFNHDRWGSMRDGAAFFNFFLNSFKDKRVCVENPVQHRYAKQIIGVDATQYIQPWMFGHSASKKTGLWLNNLPDLIPTDIIFPRMVNGKSRWDNQTDSGQNKLCPSADRWKERSKTYQGIAEAMANQWGNL